ncbi:MAG: hypothetical protein ACRDRJ_19740, partial [Streptosporangiaceae bacterium]
LVGASRKGFIGRLLADGAGPPRPVDRREDATVAISGLAAAAGLLLGGVLSQGPGWRWVLFVNLPVCALVLAGAYALLPGDRHRARLAGSDFPGAALGTAGMLLLVYALVRAPQQGWASARTFGELATAAAVLAAFAVTELRRRDPLFPFSIFRIKGLAAADVTQMIAFAAFVSVFFFRIPAPEPTD